MILYKYMSLATAQIILATNRIGFSRAGFFDDPFDTPIATPVQTGNPIEGVFAHIGAQEKSIILELNTAFLSVTRTATNALLWAHYAVNRSGAVLVAIIAAHRSESRVAIPDARHLRRRDCQPSSLVALFSVAAGNRPDNMGPLHQFKNDLGGFHGPDVHGYAAARRSPLTRHCQRARVSIHARTSASLKRGRGTLPRLISYSVGKPVALRCR